MLNLLGYEFSMFISLFLSQIIALIAAYETSQLQKKIKLKKYTEREFALVLFARNRALVVIMSFLAAIPLAVLLLNAFHITNCNIMQGILFSSGDEIRSRDLGLTDGSSPACVVDSTVQDLPYKQAKEETLQRFNTTYINSLLTRSQGNVTRAARLCGMERQALQQVMRRYGITAEPFRNPNRTG